MNDKEKSIRKILREFWKGEHEGCNHACFISGKDLNEAIKKIMDLFEEA